jgi:flagellar biosynthetic protein FliS
VDLESAPKTQIVERLFDRFDRDVESARSAIAARDIKAKAAAIDHATQIVITLRTAIDRSVAPAMCANLDALYGFVLTKLGEANAKLAIKPLEDGAKIMRDLGEAFRRAHRMVP